VGDGVGVKLRVRTTVLLAVKVLESVGVNVGEAVT
jgi:hypothetical protein